LYFDIYYNQWTYTLKLKLWVFFRCPENLHAISTHVSLSIATSRIENDLVNNFI